MKSKMIFNFNKVQTKTEIKINKIATKLQILSSNKIKMSQLTIKKMS